MTDLSKLELENIDLRANLETLRLEYERLNSECIKRESTWNSALQDKMAAAAAEMERLEAKYAAAFKENLYLKSVIAKYEETASGTCQTCRWRRGTCCHVNPKPYEPGWPVLPATYNKNEPTEPEFAGTCSQYRRSLVEARKLTETKNETEPRY